MLQKTHLKKIFSLLGLIGVLLGAFGAHGLKKHVSLAMLENWKTATFYLFVHVLAGLISLQLARKQRSSYLFLFGILIFSGSLYTLVLSGQNFWGAITPIGGLSFILAWFLLAVDIK